MRCCNTKTLIHPTWVQSELSAQVSVDCFLGGTWGDRQKKKEEESWQMRLCLHECFFGQSAMWEPCQNFFQATQHGVSSFGAKWFPLNGHARIPQSSPPAWPATGRPESYSYSALAFTLCTCDWVCISSECDSIFIPASPRWQRACAVMLVLRVHLLTYSVCVCV